MDHKGNFALITGACSGIGQHISKILAGKGYNILGVSNQASRLDKLKTELEQFHGISAVTLEMDLSQADSATALYSFCKENKLPIEVLVNCAGILVYGETAEVEPAKVSSLLNLHVTTPAMLCRLFGEQMIAQNKGYILNVSSISAVMPYPTISLYGPSKAFLRHFTRAIRTEMRPHGVNVTCLLPGATDTSFYDDTGFRVGNSRKAGLVKSPAYVAAAGVDALFRNRSESIPGVLNKLIVRLLPLIPHSLISFIYRKRYLKK
ncbi:MAG: SDR family NAD(P)-dependent oxidoreductase [Bacteroidales bacterium]|nr:SDR family NAD(P)-dependent oxidoreductase [Bacteroidales bacterium]